MHAQVWNEININPDSHLEVSLYWMAPNRIPDWLTAPANGFTIPAIKPFTCRKLALPILEDPSIRKTISAACTLLHLPVNTSDEEHMWAYADAISANKLIHKHLRRVLGAEVVVGWRTGSCFYPELQHVWWRTGGQSQWKPNSTSSQPGHKDSKETFLLWMNLLEPHYKPVLNTLKSCDDVLFLNFLARMLLQTIFCYTVLC